MFTQLQVSQVGSLVQKHMHRMKLISAHSAWKLSVRCTVKWNSSICYCMFVQTGNGSQGSIITCADKWWNSGIQYSCVMQLVQMICYAACMCKWAVERSTGYTKGVEFRVQFIGFKSGKVNNYRVNQLCEPTVCAYIFPIVVCLWVCSVSWPAGRHPTYL